MIERRLDGTYSASGTSSVVKGKTGATKIVGYGAVFYDPKDPGTEYQLSSTTRERIAPWAFDRVLTSSDDVMATLNHNMDYLLGRRSAGTLRISKDSRGLKYEIDYNPADPQHVSVMAKIQRGDLRGASFWFQLSKEKTTTTSTGYIREIQDVRLIELGPVAWPAYPSTTAGSRGEADRAARLRHIEREQVLDRIREIDRDEVQARLRQIRIDQLLRR
jgi:HK97 family phage prohead protease